MSLDSSFAALYIGPDKLGLLKAQKSKNGINIVDEGYLNYDGYDNSGFSTDPSMFLSKLLQDAGLPKGSTLIVGVPQELCLHSIGYVKLRLPQAEQFGLQQEKELKSKYTDTPADYQCIDKTVLRYYGANGLPIEMPYGLITKEIATDIGITYAKQSVITLIDNLTHSFDIKAVYTGIANAISRRFIPQERKRDDVFLISIGYAETIVAHTLNGGIMHSIHFSIGTADIICDLIKVLKIGYLHSLALFEVADLSIDSLKDDKYTINIKGDKFEYSVKRVNEIVNARISQILNSCLEALLKMDNLDIDVYLVCRGFTQERGLVSRAGAILQRNVTFAITNALLLKDRPEEEALINYASLIAPQQDIVKKKGGKFISLIRRKRIG